MRNRTLGIFILITCLAYGQTRPVNGIGTTGQVPVWVNPQVIGNSNLYQNGTQLGINTTSPNSSAALDVESTNQGFLMPQMTTMQMNDISSPATGLMVFNTSKDSLCYYGGSSWLCLAKNTIPSVGDSGLANGWGLKIVAGKPRLIKVDTTTGQANGARIATQYWVKNNTSIGTVTSVTGGYALYGGPITTSGTLTPDTTILTSQSRLTKTVNGLVQDSGIVPGYGINKTNAKPRVLSADTTTSTGLVSKSRLTKAIAGAGTVKSVATGYGLSGGTITSTGTLVADTTVLASQSRLTKSLVLYQKSISLTTTGTSGSASFSSNTLNIPTYQSAYTNLTTIGGLSNASGYLFNNGSGTFTYGNPIQDSGAANSWGLKITAAKPRLFKVDTATGNANGARLATQYWVKNNASGWGLTGNSGTTAGTNFIGTTDSVGLIFKVNNKIGGKLSPSSIDTYFGVNAGNSTGNYGNILYGNTIGTGGYINIGIGYQVFQGPLSGNYNTGIGFKALNTVTSGSGNVGIGLYSQQAITTGSRNVGIGYEANSGEQTGNDNIGIGSYAGNGANGSNNIGIGLYALTTGNPSYTGLGNIGIGYQTLQYAYNGNQNLGIGYNTGTATYYGTGNVFVGPNSGNYSNINGSYNTFIGSNTDMLSSSLNRAIAIGYNTKVSGSDLGNISNGSNTLKLAINNTTPTAALHVTGTGTTSSTTTLRIENSSNTASLLIKDNGQISVNNTTPDPSAIIDIETTTQGFLAPQMTTTQKNAISSPKEGLIVYDLTLHKLSYFNGSSWTNL